MSGISNANQNEQGHECQNCNDDQNETARHLTPDSNTSPKHEGERGEESQGFLEDEAASGNLSPLIREESEMSEGAYEAINRVAMSEQLHAQAVSTNVNALVQSQQLQNESAQIEQAIEESKRQPVVIDLQGESEEPESKKQKTLDGTAAAAPALPQNPSLPVIHGPKYLTLSNKPTWNSFIDIPQRPQQTGSHRGRPKIFKLSLLNVNQFTITGVAPSFDTQPTSLSGLGPIIRKISRDHGKAEFDRKTGKWRIPLGAYQSLFSYLNSQPITAVHGIPQQQLKIASLERARQEKGHPSVEEMVEKGVPKRIASTLAPFQRSGVDFVLEKNGRALIADEMGLGKTIQSIASMAVYREEWPLLVLSPSGARYHWESEFRSWLCPKEDEEGEEASEAILRPQEILVVGSSKDSILPHEGIKVVICSYGLAPTLIERELLTKRMFRCAIVDESHMLKNKSSKRTSTLLPILRATDRCVLLSGTPALAKPSDLWPQIEILSTENDDLWNDEEVFNEKYVRTGGSMEKAELHTMLTATIMIRRLKNDILKDLPKKFREKAFLHLLDERKRKQFHGLMLKLREGKGVLGEIARKQHAERAANGQSDQLVTEHFEYSNGATSAEQANADTEREIQVLNDRYRASLSEQLASIPGALAPYQGLPQDQIVSLARQLEGEIRTKLEAWYREQHQNIREGHEEKEKARTSVLSELYSLTGECKIPLLVDMLKRWLNDPTKGKLCIFAHHLSVLNAVRDGSGLNNDPSMYIRIDGSTTPQKRQQQINEFQNNPHCRIALLGITAAGVAVTLTASSTVWFAELFWTPAIMIQAEDRCHRIGQQARVRCVYFVARGTLDEVLWKLVENKFQELGEFVEGKEKYKMVVERTYESKHELHSIFADTAAESDEDETELSGADDEMEDFEFDQDLLHDIEQLGAEESEMLRASNTNDEEETNSSPDGDKKMPASDGNITSESQAVAAPVVGASAENAIELDLSDDEEDNTKAQAEARVATSNGNNAASTDTPSGEPADGNPTQPVSIYSFSNWRVYELGVTGTSLGLVLASFHGRVVVSDSMLAGKPEVGDVLLALNSRVFPMGGQYFQNITAAIIKALRVGGGARLLLAEDPAFTKYFKNHLHAQEKIRMEKAAALPKPNDDGVIDLIDDDD